MASTNIRELQEANAKMILKQRELKKEIEFNVKQRLYNSSKMNLVKSNNPFALEFSKKYDLIIEE